MFNPTYNPILQQFLLGWTQHPPRFAEDFGVTSTRDSECTGESSLKTDKTDKTDGEMRESPVARSVYL